MIVSYLSDTSSDLIIRILDVGCGAGIISEALARLGAEVTAIDACEDNIEAARRHAEADTSGQALTASHGDL